MININFILFLNKLFLRRKEHATKPKIKKTELWTKLWGKVKFEIYESIVMNKIPLKPNSPKDSLIDKIFEDKYPKPIIENKIIK